jgi:hypothetical protein
MIETSKSAVPTRRSIGARSAQADVSTITAGDAYQKTNETSPEARWPGTAMK